MSPIDQKRLSQFELRIGKKLPASFISTLERSPIHEGKLVIETADRIWDVRTTFTFDNVDEGDQLDHVYKRVGDVMPPETLPFAEDRAGNFYCVLLSGPQAGKVVYWDHERDADDLSVRDVSNSIEAFYANLVSDPGD